MSDLLCTALRELADEARPVPVPPGTWRRGRRSRRLRLAGVAVAVVALVAGSVGLAGSLLRGGLAPQPAGGTHAPGIPDVIYTPSSWLGTSSGPPGRLALIATAARHTSWFHTDYNAIVSVSATTGRYAFLTLPGIDESPGNVSEAVLSPDGTRIAYWLVGRRPSGWTQTPDGGFAIYNTVTGDIAAHHIRAPFGVTAGGLTWSGDSRHLLVSYVRCIGRTQTVTGSETDTGCNSGRDEPPVVWASDTGRTHLASKAEGERWFSSVQGLSPWPSGFVGVRGRHSVEVVGVASGEIRTVRLATPVNMAAARVVRSPNGHRIALVTGGRSLQVGLSSQFMANVWVARSPTDAGQAWQVHRVAHSVAGYALIGWIDKTHLACLAFDRHIPYQALDMGPPDLVSLDVTTGRTSQWVRVVPRQIRTGSPRSTEYVGLGPQLATDLLGAPLAQGVQPESPRDPRVLPAILLGVALLALVIFAARRTSLPRGDPPAAWSDGSRE